MEALASLMVPILLLLCICHCLSRALYPYWEALYSCWERWLRFLREEERKRREYKNPEEQQREDEREAQLSMLESWPGAGYFNHLPVLLYREHIPGYDNLSRDRPVLRCSL